MMSIANRISTYEILLVISKFLVFITYCLASIKINALSKHKVLYILTHYSVFLGEYSPIYQPIIKSLTILRSIPNLLTIRPCDVNEKSGAYQIALEYNEACALILSRQVLHNIKNSCYEKKEHIWFMKIIIILKNLLKLKKKIKVK